MVCLDENTIAEYLRGQLGEAQTERVEAHIDRCADCRVLVSELSRGRVRAIAQAGARGLSVTPRRPTMIRWPAAHQHVTVDDVTVDFEAGDVIAGKYRFERVIGGGGMGVVIAATHIELAQLVALKFMNPTMLGHEQAVVRFRREARAAARLRNEHVGRVLDLGTLDTGEPYIVMEYLEGEDLRARLDRVGRLAEGEAVDLALQACAAVGEAHLSGIVHRDLKPANLFVTRRSDGSPCLKVLDFGISKIVDETGDHLMITDTSGLMGSPMYTAPEQLMSARDVDGRADIWSLGVILYQMIAGKLPYHADTLPQLVARVLHEPPAALSSSGVAVSPALETIVLRCLARDPAQRFQTMDQLGRALSGWRTGADAATAATTPATAAAASHDRSDHRPRRRGIAIAVAAAAVLAASAGVWIAVERTGDEPGPGEVGEPVEPAGSPALSPPRLTEDVRAPSIDAAAEPDATAAPSALESAGSEHADRATKPARARKRDLDSPARPRSKPEQDPTSPMGDDDILEPSL